MVLTTIVTANQAADAPASNGNGTLTGGNGDTDLGTATVNAELIKVSRAATTAADTVFTAVVSSNKIKASSYCSVQISGYAGTQGQPDVLRHETANGSITITGINWDGVDALDGALEFTIIVHNAIGLNS